MSASRHAKSLVVFIGLLLMLLLAESILVSKQLQQLLYDTYRHETESQIELMADSAYEAVLKSDFVTIRTFIDRWHAANPDYQELRAIAPNGFVIAAHNRPAAEGARIISLRKTITLDGTELMRIELVASSNEHTNAIAGAVRNRLFAFAMLLITALGFVLWRAINIMAIKPLEREIAHRTIAEAALRRSHEELESKVEARTADLRRELVERQQIEADLVQKEERIRLLMDSTAEGIFGVDSKGICTFCNPSALRLLGYEHESDLLGTNMLHLVNQSQPDGSPCPEQESFIYQAYRTGQGCHNDREIFCRKDGTSFPVEYWSHPIKGGSGIHLGTVVTFIDITDRKRLESQLLHAQKMESIGTLAGGIAHDFNNILSPILGYLEIAKMIVEPGSKVESYLQPIHQAACRARDLVKQILTFSRRDSEERSPVKVDLAIKEALTLLKASLPSTIEINQNIADNCGYVMASPTKIHQIVMNLGTNAYHAMSETGGELTVTLVSLSLSAEECIQKNIALKPCNYLLLEVSDTGHGIDKVTLERIFEPYFTTKPTGQGTGMGLAVVHGIVQDYGGQILVSSEIGKGTTFHIYLPIIDTLQSTISPPASATPPQTGTERIMLVDDEELVLEVEAALLECLGYSVRAFDRPLEALAEFRLHPDLYDIIVTDMTMPAMTGDKLAEAILELRPDIPIVMCSGLNDLISEDTKKPAGIKVFISKPINFENLSNRLRAALDGK